MAQATIVKASDISNHRRNPPATPPPPYESIEQKERYFHGAYENRDERFKYDGGSEKRLNVTENQRGTYIQSFIEPSFDEIDFINRNKWNNLFINKKIKAKIVQKSKHSVDLLSNECNEDRCFPLSSNNITSLSHTEHFWTLSPAKIKKITKAFLKYKVDHSGKVFKNREEDYNVYAIEHCTVQRYSISTLYERRFRVSLEKPYEKRSIQEYKPFPSPKWAVKIRISRDYRKKCVKEPGSSVIVVCNRCSGKGRIICCWCKGNGDLPCYSCCNEGSRTICHTTKSHDYCTGITKTHCHYRRETCHFCYGNGTTRCQYCYGERATPCSKCNQTGKIEKCTGIVAEWYPRRDSYVGGATNFACQFFDKCTGHVLFSKEGNFHNPLRPITSEECCDGKLVRKSINLVEAHKIFHVNSKIRNQIHCLEEIPLYLVKYELKGKRKETWVVGENLTVYDAKKYKKD